MAIWSVLVFFGHQAFETLFWVFLMTCTDEERHGCLFEKFDALFGGWVAPWAHIQSMVCKDVGELIHSGETVLRRLQNSTSSNMDLYIYIYALVGSLTL